MLLNLLAVPLMGLVQIAGTLAVILDGVGPAAALFGVVAHAAAFGIVESARLVDLVPWLTARVPPPPLSLVLAYYGSLAAISHPSPVGWRWAGGRHSRGWRVGAGAGLAGSARGAPQANGF